MHADGHSNVHGREAMEDALFDDQGEDVSQMHKDARSASIGTQGSTQVNGSANVGTSCKKRKGIWQCIESASTKASNHCNAQILL